MEPCIVRMNDNPQNTVRSKSAGGVVVNSRGEILVTSQRGNSWSLPKGHVEVGEDDLTTAKRETEEETGVKDLQLVKDLGTYARYKIAKNGVGEDTSELKEIHMFLFRTTDETLVPTDHDNHPEARWIRPEEVSKLLTHPKDAEFFDSLRSEIISATRQQARL